MKNILIYGANGFVGREIVKLAKNRGLNPVVAGRNEKEIKDLASTLQLDHAVFGMEDTELLDSHISRAQVLLNCAGPFYKTYLPFVRSCLKNKCHYLDITGEIPVFKGIHTFHKEALQRKLMLLPGVGFDVAPTDCLAAYLHSESGKGHTLTLAFYSEGPAGIPPGTIKTAISLIPYGILVREKGKLIPKKRKGIETRVFDFNGRKKKTLRISWGDLFTAYHSTGIPNIEVFSSFSKSTMIQLKLMEYFRPLLSSPFAMRTLQKIVKGGSTREERDQTQMYVYGEVIDQEGNKFSTHLKGPEGAVEWTSRIAVNAVERTVNGQYKSGYQTPSSAFGYRFVLDDDKVEMGGIRVEKCQ
jgi:short subunit dehydrogenase-like uncharacterized protein